MSLSSFSWDSNYHGRLFVISLLLNVVLGQYFKLVHFNIVTSSTVLLPVTLTCTHFQLLMAG